MNLQSLFEAVSVDGAELRTEFKKIAAKCDLSFTHGMQWPQASAGGVWFSFVLAPAGGERAESKEGEDRLPMEMRIKAAIVMLAKRLEAIAAEGHTIKIVKGGRDLKAPDAKPGTFKEVLTDSLTYMSSPPGNAKGAGGKGLTFFIGNKGGKKEKVLIIHVGEFNTMRLYCQDDAEEIKKLHKTFVAHGKKTKFAGSDEEVRFFDYIYGYGYKANGTVEYRKTHPDPACAWVNELNDRIFNYVKSLGYQVTPYKHDWKGSDNKFGKFGRDVSVEVEPASSSKAVQPDIVYIKLEEAKHIINMINEAASAA